MAKLHFRIDNSTNVSNSIYMRKSLHLRVDLEREGHIAHCRTDSLGIHEYNKAVALSLFQRVANGTRP